MAYTSYLDVGGGKDLFFYFFESRGNPKKDPVIMWINGGPGCSSSIGLFMELGPCTVNNNPKTLNDTKPNPYSWNEHANIFFVDEPVNVGFSQARNGQVVGTAEEAGQDIAAFIDIWFDTFKEFKGRDFHMAGESYGGRYLPVFASAVHDQNKMLIAQGKEPVNLKSVMIGNGITSESARVDDMPRLTRRRLRYHRVLLPLPVHRPCRPEPDRPAYRQVYRDGRGYAPLPQHAQEVVHRLARPHRMCDC